MIYTSTMETPLGTMLACATDEGICMLEFGDKKDIDKEIVYISNFHKLPLITQAHFYFAMLQQELDAYFNNTLRIFKTPLLFSGTPFQIKVWKALQNIGYGNTLSYMQLSKILGNTKAIRAIAHANGQNHIAILVPCHRVIGANGSLTGYAGGLWRKKALLELELKNTQKKLFLFE